jgi:hypothetical protein
MSFNQNYLTDNEVWAKLPLTDDQRQEILGALIAEKRSEHMMKLDQNEPKFDLTVIHMEQSENQDHMC